MMHALLGVMVEVHTSNHHYQSLEVLLYSINKSPINPSLITPLASTANSRSVSATTPRSSGPRHSSQARASVTHLPSVHVTGHVADTLAVTGGSAVICVVDVELGQVACKCTLPGEDVYALASTSMPTGHVVAAAGKFIDASHSTHKNPLLQANLAP